MAATGVAEACAGVVPGPRAGRGGRLVRVPVRPLGPARRAAAATAGAHGQCLGTVSGPTAAGDLPWPGGTGGGLPPAPQWHGGREWHGGRGGHPATVPGSAAGALPAARDGAAGAGHGHAELHRLGRRRLGAGAAEGARLEFPGLFVRVAVGFTAAGQPLGVSGLETRARPEAEPEQESRRWFRGFAQGRELGRLSPQTRVVVGDRESDIYTLFQPQAEHAVWSDTDGWRRWRPAKLSRTCTRRPACS